MATPNHAEKAQLQASLAKRAQRAEAQKDHHSQASKYSYSEAKHAPQYQSFFAKPLVLKSDLTTNAVRPHFNPSFLQPDMHNLS
jgi:hypothetical protein